MLFDLTINRKIRGPRFLTTGFSFSVALLLFTYALPAHAVRLVYYDVAGTNQTFNTDERSSTAFISRCSIFVTNSGPSIQKVTVTLAHTVANSNISNAGTATPMTSSAGTATASTDTPGTEYVMPLNDTKMFSWDFPTLVAALAIKQDVRCTGQISVDDNDSTAPGFITASGLLYTWMQSPPPMNSAGTVVLLRAPTSITTTPFNIGEGRPF